jgi:voltage-gated potassium channel
MRRFRQLLYRQLDPRSWPHHGLSPLNRVIGLLIMASVLVAVVDSEPTVMAGHELMFRRIEIGFGLLFALEYLARLWTCVEHPGPHDSSRWPALAARWRFACSPAGLFDLLALAPLAVAGLGSEVYVLRLVRVLRVLRLARLGQFSSAMRLLTDAVRSRRFELLASAAVSMVILLISSTLLYLVEGPAQPETFGSIPRAIWWSVETMTTVGYGDAVPQSPLGKLLAGLTAILSIGFIAMPTGILAAAFSDALQRRRRDHPHS